MAFLKNLFGRQQKPDPIRVTGSHYRYKTRFSLIGTTGAGKSTVVAGLVMTAASLSSMDPQFYCRVLENETNIIDDSNNLRYGHFPRKTSPYQTYVPEAGLLVNYGSRMGNKKVQVPFADIAGEDIQQIIPSVRRGNPLIADAWAANNRLVNYVKDSAGFILVLPASESMLFKSSKEFAKQRQVGLSNDPDTNLHRIMDRILQHKDRSGGKKIKGIAVVVTKWDLVAPKLQNVDIDLYEDRNGMMMPSERGMRRFMNVAFTHTDMLLKSANVSNVRFFPSHFTAERDEKGDVVKWPEGGDKIELNHDFEANPPRIVPKYSERSYIDLFGWLRSFAS